MTVELKSR